MPMWIKAIYRALLNKGGAINNPDNYVVVVMYKPHDYILFVKKQNAAKDYSAHTSLKEYVQRKIDFYNDKK
jgi:hypothetical protein